jgi:hypothetical protein
LSDGKGHPESFPEMEETVGPTGVYMREGTTSRVMAADRAYGEFYGFYVVSEYFGYPRIFIRPVSFY